MNVPLVEPLEESLDFVIGNRRRPAYLLRRVRLHCKKRRGCGDHYQTTAVHLDFSHRADSVYEIAQMSVAQVRFPPTRAIELKLRVSPRRNAVISTANFDCGFLFYCVGTI